MMVDITSYNNTTTTTTTNNNKSHEIEEAESEIASIESSAGGMVDDNNDNDNNVDNDLSYYDDGGDNEAVNNNNNNNDRLFHNNNNNMSTGSAITTSSVSSPHQQITLATATATATATTTKEAADSTNANSNNNNSNNNNNKSNNKDAAVDQILAYEMNKLSVEERTQALEDVHGVSTTKEVSTFTIKYKLNELDIYINKNKTKIYKLAESLSTNYVQNEYDFRLQFLYADDFDVPNAAKRLFNFLYYKLDLFGKDLLTTNIKLIHLNDIDMLLLKESAIQSLLQKDTAGRPILCTFPQYQPKSNYHNLLRVAFYVMMSIIDTYPDEVRTRGMVSVFYNTSIKPQSSTMVPVNIVWKSFKLRHSIPIKTSATHFCTRNVREPILRTIFKTIWWKLSRSDMRSRARRHVGNDVEIQNQLRGFGLPMDCFPFDNDGKMNFQYHHEWIRRRRIMEETELSSELSSELSKSAGEEEGMTTMRIEEEEDLLSLSSWPATTTTTTDDVSTTIITANNNNDDTNTNTNDDDDDPAMVVGKKQLLDDDDDDDDKDMSAKMLLGIDMMQAELSMTSTIDDNKCDNNNMQFMMPEENFFTTTSHQQQQQQQQQQNLLGNNNNDDDDDGEMQFDKSDMEFMMSEFVTATSHQQQQQQQNLLGNNNDDDDGEMQFKDYSVNDIQQTKKDLFVVGDEEGDPKSNINSALSFVPTVGTESTTTTTESSDLTLMDKKLPISSSRSPSSSPPPPKLNNDPSSSISAVGSYVTPTPDDILFGRGKPMRNHPGNVKFRNILERHRDEYNIAPKFEKSIIAKLLVRTLSESGSRFLKPTSEGTTGWVIVDNRTAQDKVSQYFRSRRGGPKHNIEK